MILEALAGNAAAGAAAAGVSQMFTRQNMAYQNRMQVENQLATPARSVQGLRMAGLSPALAVNGNFSPAQGVSASPSPLANLGQLDPVSRSAIELNDEQKNLISENANLVKEKVEGERLENENKRTFNEVVSERLTTYFEDMAAAADDAGDENKADWYRTQLDMFSRTNRGGLDALKDSDGYFTSVGNNRVQVFANQLKEQVLKQQLSDGTSKRIADMPNREWSKICTEILELQSKIQNLNADSQLKAAQVKEVIEQSRLMHNQNFLAIWDDEGAARAIGSLVPNLINSLGAGAGFAAGSRLAGKGAAAPAAGRSVTQSVKSDPKAAQAAKDKAYSAARAAKAKQDAARAARSPAFPRQD